MRAINPSGASLSQPSRKRAGRNQCTTRLPSSGGIGIRFKSPRKTENQTAGFRMRQAVVSITLRSSTQPWATLDHASSRVKALNADGTTVCFRDGVYTGGNSLYERFTVPTVFRAENAYRAVLQNNSRVMQLFGARNLVFRGFEIRHTGAGSDGLVVQVQQDGGTGNWAESIVFRDNVFHDSWNNDILNGVIKSVVFGVAVTWIAVFEGYDAPPTAEGVSRATTRTVVAASLAVLGLDFILTAWMFSI